TLGRFLAIHVKAVLRTIARSHARELASRVDEIARKARMQASCTTSSASVRLPVSQRAKAKASSTWGSTASANRCLSSMPPRAGITLNRRMDVAHSIGLARSLLQILDDVRTILCGVKMK